MKKTLLICILLCLITFFWTAIPLAKDEVPKKVLSVAKDYVNGAVKNTISGNNNLNQYTHDFIRDKLQKKLKEEYGIETDVEQLMEDLGEDSVIGWEGMKEKYTEDIYFKILEKVCGPLAAPLKAAWEIDKWVFAKNKEWALKGDKDFYLKEFQIPLVKQWQKEIADAWDNKRMWSNGENDQYMKKDIAKKLRYFFDDPANEIEIGTSDTFADDRVYELEKVDADGVYTGEKRKTKHIQFQSKCWKDLKELFRKMKRSHNDQLDAYHKLETERKRFKKYKEYLKRVTIKAEESFEKEGKVPTKDEFNKRVEDILAKRENLLGNRGKIIEQTRRRIQEERQKETNEDSNKENNPWEDGSIKQPKGTETIQLSACAKASIGFDLVRKLLGMTSPSDNEKSTIPESGGDATALWEITDTSGDKDTSEESTAGAGESSISKSSDGTTASQETTDTSGDKEASKESSAGAGKTQPAATSKDQASLGTGLPGAVGGQEEGVSLPGSGGTAGVAGEEKSGFQLSGTTSVGKAEQESAPEKLTVEPSPIPEKQTVERSPTPKKHSSGVSKLPW